MLIHGHGTRHAYKHVNVLACPTHSYTSQSPFWFVSRQAAHTALSGRAPPSTRSMEMSVPPCSMQHGDRRAQNDKKRKLLFAAEDGCAQCVKRLVLQDNVPADSQSDFRGFSALDFALWGKEKAQKSQHDDVISFLQARIREDNATERHQGVVPRKDAGTPPPPPQSCRCWRLHGPRNRSIKYELFHAAKDGCLECVTRLVSSGQVPVNAVSDTQAYTVLDFADWGEERKIEGNHADVKSYLREQLGSARGSAAAEPQGAPPDPAAWNVVVCNASPQPDPDGSVQSGPSGRR